MEKKSELLQVILGVVFLLGLNLYNIIDTSLYVDSFQKTQGYVVEIDEREQFSNRLDFYNVKVEYTPINKERRTRTLVIEAHGFDYEVGEVIEILYSKSNPNIIATGSFWDFYFEDAFDLLLPLSIIFVGVYSVFRPNKSPESNRKQPSIKRRKKKKNKKKSRGF
jgi:hypothetical protein